MTVEQNQLVEYRRIYKWLNSVASNRLTVSTFFAGFTLTAFIGLFTTLPAINELKLESILILLADLCLGVATLLFIFTAMATYVTMQRVTSLSDDAIALFSDDSTRHADLSSGDIALLNECSSMYNEPATFIVWGLLLIVISIILVTGHIYYPLAIVLLIVLGAIILQVKTLHRILRRVLLGRSIR